MHKANNPVFYLNGEFREQDDQQEDENDCFSEAMSLTKEVIRCYPDQDGRALFKGIEHCSHFVQRANMYTSSFSYTADQLMSICHKILEINRLNNAWISLDLLFTAEHLSLLIRSRSYSTRKPTTLDIRSHEFTLDDPFNENTMDLSSLDLLVDSSGKMLGIENTDFYFQHDHTLFTTRPNALSQTITRGVLQELAKELGYQVITQDIHLKMLIGVEGAFLAGPLHEIQGIRSVDSIPFRMAWEDTIGFELSMAYQRMVRGEWYNDFILV
ncbi:MAG: aminotransferase class IV [Bacteroidota bacterium]